LYFVQLSDGCLAGRRSRIGVFAFIVKRFRVFRAPLHWKKTADEFCDEKGINLLITHLYMNKKGAPILEEPEGEKPIKIGNADLVFSDIIPQQIQYTALGHLHGFQNIGTDEKPVVYSSSPLCYSFSEAGQTKYVSIIEAEPNKNVSFEKIALQNGKKLVRKTFDSIENTIEWLKENPNTLVELTLESETFLKAEERKTYLSISQRNCTSHSES
ncbi:metallophosphoesterase family protein, partial [Chryseobacterium indoltheticum]|uniref:metallophosphoesterase family protein n=1 Tax=Chryseobacterium indoltheticum TaxID=254 RepID=UPI003F496B79